MADTYLPESDLQEFAALDATLNRIADKIGGLFAEMKESQKEIERLRADNDARLTKIEATLDRMLAS